MIMMESGYFSPCNSHSFHHLQIVVKKKAEKSLLCVNSMFVVDSPTFSQKLQASFQMLTRAFTAVSGHVCGSIFCQKLHVLVHALYEMAKNCGFKVAKTR